MLWLRDVSVASGDSSEVLELETCVCVLVVPPEITDVEKLGVFVEMIEKQSVQVKRACLSSRVCFVMVRRCVCKSLKQLEVSDLCD